MTRKGVIFILVFILKSKSALKQAKILKQHEVMVAELREEHRVALDALEARHRSELERLKNNTDATQEAWEGGRREEEAKWRKEMENLQNKRALEIEEAKVLAKANCS